MNRIKLLIIVIAAMLAMASCGDDTPALMEWECPVYDQTEISVQFTPGFYTQGQIMAKRGYSGEVTLVCTNYSEIFIDENAKELVNLGCKASKVGDNGVKFTFSTINLPDDTTMTGMVTISAKSKNGTTTCTFQIGRES
ncbi:MAG: hypothetical protein K2N16_05650 [Muribaculaceae bacterium]|nr:hypothetical protein [Muribaculaceae bacterium]